MQKRWDIKTNLRISLIVKSLCVLMCLMIIISKNVISENTSHLLSLTGLSQDGIPTGCESVSTVAALQYQGIDISIDEFIKTYLPCEGFYRQNGVLYGPDPHQAFAGNPYKSASLGCYPNVILKALHKMKAADYPGMNALQFEDVSGNELETLATQYIAQQIPVILWVTMNMKEPYKGMQYYLEDGTLYTWTAQEHCTVLCGYDENYYYIMDPLADGEIVAYAKELVETRYEELGKYAVVLY